MAKNNVSKIIIGLLIFVLVLLVAILNKGYVKNITMDKFLQYEDENEEINKQLILKLLKSLDDDTIKTIGIDKKDIVNSSIQNYNINIITKKNHNYYIILHNKNPKDDKEYLTVFKRGFLFYKKLGSPIKQNSVIDIFLLPVDTEEEYILFTRDLIGFKTAPLDLLCNLNAFVYNDKKRNFTEALKIIENSEEYQIITDNNKNMYKKFRTKSDILLTNNDYPIIKILTHYYEAVSTPTEKELTGTPPYSLNFDITKTENEFEKYFYDTNFYHFLLGYIKLDNSDETVGIVKKNTKIIDNNFKDTYTIIKKDGEVFEIFSNFTIIKTE